MRALFSLLFLAASAEADTLSGRLEFDGAQPFAAVVYAREPGAQPAPATVDQMNREFTERMVAASVGGEVSFKNSDKARHNIFANHYQTQTRFDVGLMPTGRTVQVKTDWPEDTVVRVGCAIHPYMESYIANIRSAHYQVLKLAPERGAKPAEPAAVFFRLDAVPEGVEAFSLLIPYYDPLTVKLKRGESQTVSISKGGVPKGRWVVTRSGGG
ncbi:MAG: hypothetical protein HYV16_07910 [Gammaproteobacteria bacterium]|nr:hypothetical protein [Gammaproteobacteria bacterium]